MPLEQFIQRLEEKSDLSEEDAQKVVKALLLVEVSEIQDEEIKRLLKAWSAKGFTEDELVGAARAMLDRAREAHPLAGLQRQPVLLDTCGTGGDGLRTPNISTLAGLIVAAAGVPVAKHGNRAATSRFGSADLLMALGLKIDPEPRVVAECINTVGFGFLFAPTFHHATKRVAAVRRTLGVNTIFNVLGPLTNPAPITHQVLGVADDDVMLRLAKALQRLGCVKAWVVRGADGLDEVSPGATTEVLEVTPVGITSFQFTPEQCGFSHRIQADELVVNDIGAYKLIAEKILKNGDCSPYAEAVFLNAGVALHVADKVPSVKDGLELARRVAKSGRPWKLVEALRRITHAA